ncbi:hypothetical protein ACLKA6_013870 [Drosophila palustris]
MHANVIIRPTPRAAPPSFAKFTLQTVSLPRLEYPVAISLAATTPTTPSSSVQSPLPTHATGARAKDVATTSRQHPLTSIHVQPTRQRDQKSVKQLTNNTTRRGFSGSREISADSGIANMEMALDSGSSSGGSDRSKRSRSRPRNLQMVMSGRHTFDADDKENLILVSEYVNDIYDYLYDLEMQQPIRNTHLNPNGSLCGNDLDLDVAEDDEEQRATQYVRSNGNIRRGFHNDNEANSVESDSVVANDLS